MDLESIWPPYSLTIRCGDMELSPVRESDLPELAELARGGVRRDGLPAFAVDWDSGADEDVARNLAQYHWGTRARFSPSSWTIEFTVRVDGRAVGVQGVSSTDFPATHRVTTGSWLALRHQGEGYGTRMRATVLTAFAEHFDARHFESAYIEGNHASRRVSEKIGYSPNGVSIVVAADGSVHREYRVVLAAADLVKPAEQVVTDGAAQMRSFLGLS